MTIVRGQQVMVFPTRFMLVAASNPCPCGLGGTRCQLHAGRPRPPPPPPLGPAAGPHRHPDARRAPAVRGAAPADRADLGRRSASASSPPASARRTASPASPRPATPSSPRARSARSASITPSALRLLAELYDRHTLSARGHTRILRVARTVADLDGSDVVGPEHVNIAASLRLDDARHSRRRHDRGEAPAMTACDDCLRRTDLIAAIAGRLQVEFKQRDRARRACSRCPTTTCSSSAPARSARRYRRFDAPAARARAARGRGSDGLPLPRRVPGAAARPRRPAGGAARPRRPGRAGRRGRRWRSSAPGARRRTGWRSRARSAAGCRPRACRSSRGSRSASTRRRTPARSKRPGATIGVLAGSAHVAYPARGWRLHAAVAERGAVISEMPPGAEAHRWCFVARNRIIAALGAATVVVQATERSGSLTTADFAAELGRAVGAVPGPGHDPAVGRHARPDPGRRAADPRRRRRARTARGRDRPRLRGAGRAAAASRSPPPLQRLLDAVEDGSGALTRARRDARSEARAALAGLGELERLGPGPPRLRRALGAAAAQRMTQVSLAPPFWDELTTSAPSERATRVSPPGSTRGVAALAEEHERAEVDVTRREPAALDDGRVGGEHDHALGDPGARVGDHRRAGGLDVLAARRAGRSGRRRRRGRRAA